MDNNRFLGTGWSFPPQFSKATESVIMSSGEENINQNLQALFDTKLGEKIMNFNYGTKLSQLVFERIGATLIGEIEETIANAILFYAPRIKLEEVVVDDSDYMNGVLKVSVIYIVRTTNNRGNYVYPFYLTEGTNLI